jgi:hypothetical protein
MVKFLEIWCLNNYGIPLFYQKDHKKSAKDKNSDSADDAQLISGLFSAVQVMAESTFNDDIIAIELKHSKLLFNKGEKITIVGKVSNSEDFVSARNALDDVTNRFILEYDDILDDWMGNTLVFDKFKDKITEYCIPLPPIKKKRKKKKK